MKHPCPCCGHYTLSLPGNDTYEICPVCFWEDDGVQFNDPDYEGGANPTSLREAQKNFKQFGACDEGMLPFVRPAAADEPHTVNKQEDLNRQMDESARESIERYEILPSLPACGPMYIPITVSGEPFYSEGLVVRFNKTDNTQWIANFQPGWTDLTGIFELRGTPQVLVIAGGTAYLINPDQEKPLAVFGIGYTTVLTASDGRFVLIDTTDCTIVELNGSFWHTERISLDGIKEAQLTDNIVSGLAYYPTYDAVEWVNFSYNIDTKVLVGGSYPKSEKTKKLKWQFWK